MSIDKSACRARRMGTALFATAVGIVALAAQPAAAQRFQDIYGLAGSTETQHGGVVQTVNGEYVTCGGTDALSGQQDVYVIRIDAAGNTVWDNVYPLSAFPSYATNVKECANGDLIVVGDVQTSAACPSCHDAFAMRLDAAGNVLRLSFYGDPATDETATDVVETAYGNGTTTFAGDFVVTGIKGTGTPNGNDGYMFRIPNGCGPSIWERSYDVQGLDDELNGLDELNLNFTGDIIATGMTFHFNIPGTEDVWILRVDGNTGASIPGASASYGIDIGDRGNSIQELQYGASAGHVVVAGTTWNMTEAYVLEVDPVPACMPMVASNAFGDGTQLPDEAMSVREITNPAIGTQGDVVVVGYTSLAPLGGASDIFMQQFAQGSLAAVGAFNVYGGSDDDYGEEVAEATNSVAPYTLGFAIAGLTYSTNIVPPGDPNQIYVIKTDIAGNTPCNNTTASPVFPPTGTVEQCVKVHDKTYATGSYVFVPWFSLTGGSSLCYALPKRSPDPEIGDDGTIAFNGSAGGRNVAANPNPVVRHGVLSLAFQQDPNAPTTVVVADLLGREIARRTVGAGNKRMVLPMATEGWAAGTYMITVRSSGEPASTRLVVADR